MNIWIFSEFAGKLEYGNFLQQFIDIELFTNLEG